MLFCSLYHAFKIINVLFWRLLTRLPNIQVAEGLPKWPKISYFGHFERFCPPRNSWNIPYSDKNDRSYFRNHWYLVENGLNAIWKGFERKKIDFFHFWAIFLYVLSENPYILESQLAPNIQFCKTARKDVNFCLKQKHLQHTNVQFHSTNA